MKAGYLLSQQGIHRPSAGRKSPQPPLFQRGEILASSRRTNLASNAPLLRNGGLGVAVNGQPMMISNAPPFEKGGLGGIYRPCTMKGFFA